MLPFAIGLLAGAAAVQLAKKGLPAKQLHQAGQSLKKSSVSGLTALEHSAAKLRSKLESPDSSKPNADAPAEQETPTRADE
jgi:phospholipase/lecithinase/hemolysin